MYNRNWVEKKAADLSSTGGGGGGEKNKKLSPFLFHTHIQMRARIIITLYCNTYTYI